MTSLDARKLREWLDERFDEDEPIEVIRPPAPERFFCGQEGCAKCDLIGLKLGESPKIATFLPPIYTRRE